MLKRLPWLLIYLRLLLTLPAMILPYFHVLGTPYVCLLIIAALTDIYDGVLARKYNVETAAIRQLDSIVDTVFFIGVFIGVYIANPVVIRHYSWGFGGIIGLELLRYLFDYAKFRRGASYHAISAKFFGVSLLFATIALMGFKKTEPFMSIAIVLGLLSELEGLLISFILPEWTYNVKHFGKAMKLRKQKTT